MQLLDQEQAHDERLRALASTYQGTDRILSGEGLTVRIEDHGSAEVAAWTSGSEITFNRAAITGIDSLSVERMNGINFHELSHVLYTPRRGTALIQTVLDNGWTYAFNVLEDQRIETLLTARYPSTIPWLTAAVARWVLDADAQSTGYLFVRGRRYLDGRLRGALRSAFTDQSLLPDLDRIIDEYRLLLFPTDYDRAEQLVDQFHRLLDQVRSAGGTEPCACPNGHGDRPVEVLTEGRPRGITEQRTARDRAQDGEPEVAPSPDTESEDTPGTTEVGGGHRAAGQPVPLESIVKDIAQEILNEIRTDDNIREEIRQRQDQVRGKTGSDILRKSEWKPRTPDQEYLTALNSLRNTLRRLLLQADPGWESETNSGRLNVHRWLRERNIDIAFDRWDEGVHDALDLEVVVMLDESGSMNHRFRQAANAMWVIKRALDGIDVSTTVITFDSDSRVLYHRNEKATGSVRFAFSGGATDPTDGLEQAARIFARSDKTQKILVILTDGDWGSFKRPADHADSLIRRFNTNGVVTALGYISDEPESFKTHNCQIAQVVSNTVLVKFVSDIVTASIASRIGR